jgi:hypothetical protein
MLLGVPKLFSLRIMTFLEFASIGIFEEEDGDIIDSPAPLPLLIS